MDGGTKRDFRITLSLPVDSGMRRTGGPKRGNSSTRVPSNRHALTLKQTNDDNNDDSLEAGQQQQEVVIDVSDVGGDDVLKLADKKARPDLSRNMFLMLFWIGLISIVVVIHITRQQQQKPRRAALFDSTTAVNGFVNVTVDRAASVVHFDACCRSATQIICGIACALVVNDNTAMCKLPANMGAVYCVFYFSE